MLHKLQEHVHNIKRNKYYFGPKIATSEWFSLTNFHQTMSFQLQKKNICLKGTTQIKAQSILSIQHSYAIQA